MQTITIEITPDQIEKLQAAKDRLDGLFSIEDLASLAITAHLEPKTPDEIRDDALDALHDLSTTEA